ncbi:MAG: enoyl-CoA hydratase/isomerase family protein [Deltaproteobacteria bacterium]|nr:enoyl-CoA hydratase/isomerase family protein [Deltaproteobacteria bacterium]
MEGSTERAGLRVRADGAVFEIVLDRPAKRNAIDMGMLERLREAIAEARQVPGVRAVLLRGEGKAFSAGIDVTALMSLGQVYGPDWARWMRDITRDIQSVFNALEQLELPVIALLHGYCLGLGLELALACDWRIAAAGTRLGLPEVRLGLIPDVGGSTRLSRLVGPGRAKELVMTGRQIEAEQAERWGLVNRVVDEGELEATGRELVAELGGCAPLAVGMAKRVIDGGCDLARGLALEGWAQSQLVRSEDLAEGLQAFAQKRPPEFKGR